MGVIGDQDECSPYLHPSVRDLETLNKIDACESQKNQYDLPCHKLT